MAKVYKVTTVDPVNKAVIYMADSMKDLLTKLLANPEMLKQEFISIHCEGEVQK